MNNIININKQLCALCIGAITLLAFSAPLAFADEHNNRDNSPYVLPMVGEPFGQSYKEWAIDFSRWAYSIPLDVNPVLNPDYNVCTQPQHGKVWFVATGSANAACEIPNGKAIFVHLGAYTDTYPCPDVNFKPAKGQTLAAFLIADAKTIMDYYISNEFFPNELYIDGKDVVDNKILPKLRLSTGLFSLTGDLSLAAVDTCVTGTPQKAVTDGFFAIIEGLKPGIHHLKFKNSQTGAPEASMTLTIGNNKIKDD